VKGFLEEFLDLGLALFLALGAEFAEALEYVG
jgi:hypothetical protein